MPDVRDEDWEASHLHVLLYEQIDMCGCGWGDDAYYLVRDLLDHFHDRDDRSVVEMIGSTGAAQLVLRRLQVADLIDHGTSVTSSWTTEKGRYARHLMHKHEPGGLDHVGVPDCYDWRDTWRCPDECWVPTDDVPPEPPRPSMDELMEAARAESAATLAEMNPVERMVYDRSAATMESMMLFGSPTPPAVLPEPGGLARAAGLDLDALARDINARLNPPNGGWMQALLDEAAGLGNSPVENAAKQMAGLLHEDQQRGILFRDRLKPADPDDRLPSGGRNAYIGCHEIDGTIIHGRPHSCPVWARGTSR